MNSHQRRVARRRREREAFPLRVSFLHLSPQTITVESILTAPQAATGHTLDAIAALGIDRPLNSSGEAMSDAELRASLANAKPCGSHRHS